MDTEKIKDFVPNPTLYDLIQASSGRDSTNDIPNASCVLFCDILHMDGSDPTPVSRLQMVNAEVNIFRHADFSTIDLKFDTKFNSELTALVSSFDQFTDSKNSMKDDAMNFPMMRLCIVPNVYGGRFYICAANPIIWGLRPAGIDGEPRVFQIAVRDEDLEAYDIGEDESETENTVKNDANVFDDNDGISALAEVDEETGEIPVNPAG